MLRLLCDEMLRRLGRWLRAAGYDTAIAAGGVPDHDLVARCLAEGRTLLTRDRHLVAFGRGMVRAALVPGPGLDHDARWLRDHLGIDWRLAPFTRCLVDNTPLTPAPVDAAERVPPASRDIGGPLFLCPECGRLYWPGSHLRHMRTRLAAWQAG